MREKYAIWTENLTKKFGNFTAVDNVNLRVAKGEIFGFLGANGAGKTTAMRMLTGLNIPTSGQAWVAGFDVYKNADVIKSRIGYMSQKFSLYNDLKVWENIEFYGGIYGMNLKDVRIVTERLLTRLGLEAEKDVLVKDLPLGWKQRLAFSVAIMHQPDIVFLDEPTGGVDPVTRRHFWNLIYEAAVEGITVFITTHYMDEAEYCDRVGVMVDGRLEALGSPAELKDKFGATTMDDVFYQLARKATRNE